MDYLKFFSSHNSDSKTDAEPNVELNAEPNTDANINSDKHNLDLSKMKETYDKQGYEELRSFIDPNTVKEMNEVIDNLNKTLKPSETNFDESSTGKIKQIQYLHTHHKIFADLLENLRPVAQALTGEEDLEVLNMQLFEKHPDISKPTRSHQDNGYFKVTPAIALTFWISLDRIDEDNGALYYAPYTDLTPTRRHQRYHKQTTFRVRSGVPGLSLCLHEHPEEEDKIMVTNPGDILVHHCNLVHRAEKNKSDRRRRAIGVVFIPKVCKKDERLMGYFNKQLKEDILLQEFKDPKLYSKLREEYKYLF